MALTTSSEILQLKRHIYDLNGEDVEQQQRSQHFFQRFRGSNHAVLMGTLFQFLNNITQEVLFTQLDIAKTIYFLKPSIFWSRLPPETQRDFETNFIVYVNGEQNFTALEFIGKVIADMISESAIHPSNIILDNIIALLGSPEERLSKYACLVLSRISNLSRVISYLEGKHSVLILDTSLKIPLSSNVVAVRFYAFKAFLNLIAILRDLQDQDSVGNLFGMSMTFVKNTIDEPTRRVPHEFASKCMKNLCVNFGWNKMAVVVNNSTQWFYSTDSKSRHTAVKLIAILASQFFPTTMMMGNLENPVYTQMKEWLKKYKFFIDEMEEISRDMSVAQRNLFLVLSWAVKD